MYDLLVVGGGPAGLAAGIRARQLGLEVALFEPKASPIDKACGEGLMPAAVDALEALGVSVEALGGYEFRGIRYRDARDDRWRADGDFPSGRGMGVRRVALHRALSERTEEVGVERIARRVEEVRQTDGFVEAGGVRGRFLIAADGLHSDVRRQFDLGDSGARTPRYGIRRHFEVAPWVDRVEVHWHDAAEAYVTPVGEKMVGVAMLFEQKGRFDELLENFPELRRRLEGAEVLSEDRGAGPFEQPVRKRVEGRVLLAGDAAGYLDALTGEGVALGLKTATAAVECVAAGAPESYERRYREETREYFLWTGLLLDVTRWRWTHRPLIWTLDRVPGLFDWVLERLGHNGEASRGDSVVANASSVNSSLGMS